MEGLGIRLGSVSTTCSDYSCEQNFPVFLITSHQLTVCTCFNERREGRKKEASKEANNKATQHTQEEEGSKQRNKQ